MTKQVLERLKMERASLQSQYEAIGNQIKGMDRAVALHETCDGSPGGAPAVPAAPPRMCRKPIKDIVLGILADHGPSGLSAAQVIETAANQGTALDRASVASLLSRLKREGVLVLNGNAYSPPKLGEGAIVMAHPRQVA